MTLPMEPAHHGHHSKNAYHPHPRPELKSISKRLQGEVDVILEHIDEKSLFAEFRQEEIFDIQNGDKKEFIRHTLDERISSSAFIPRPTKLEMARRVSTKGMGKISRLIYYLFKPLEY